MLKERINGALAAMTGYQLRRVDSSAEAAHGPGPQPAEAARPPSPSPPPPEKASAPARPKPKKGNLPAHYDAASKQVIRQVKPRTMTSPEKLYGLIMATRYVNAHRIPGAIVECGVWRGGSMQAAALTLLEAGAGDRDLHLFDTFEGMPPPTEHDKRPSGRTAEEMLRNSDRDAKIWAVATLDDVRTAMEETDYPAERIHYHPGMVEETIPRDAPERISILRLDTDWYESTRHELEHLYDRLSPGGVLIIDDYGGWEGSRKATEEFLAKTGAPLLLLPISAGRIAVKPNI